MSGAATSDPSASPVFMPESTFGKHTGAAEHIRLLHDRFPQMGNTTIANKVGCDESTVRDVLARYARHCSLEELRSFQANEADIIDAIREQSLASITPDKLANASYLQLVTGSAILMDKSRLIRGQPTSIHVTALLDVAEMLRERRDRGELPRQLSPDYPQTMEGSSE